MEIKDVLPYLPFLQLIFEIRVDIYRPLFKKCGCRVGEPQAIIQIVAADNVPVGVIDDLKMELRKLESLKIRYVREPARDGVTRYMPPMPSFR